MSDIIGLSHWLIIARAVHFGACLLLFGLFAFDRLVADGALKSDREIWNRIARKLVAIAIPGALLSGVLWFVLLAIDMGGAADVGTMRIVWSQTHFGAVWKSRLGFWFAATVSAIWMGWGYRKSHIRNLAAWIALAMSGLLALSLARAGHGESGRLPPMHLIADTLHLLAAGLWPTGLLPFLLLLIKLRSAPQEQRWPLIAAITSRFSLLSLTAVALLAGTGILNSCCLIGGFGDLISTTYGRVLLIKIFLFLVMIGIGAVNLLILKPRLTNLIQNSDDRLNRAADQLQWQVFAELLLGGAVLVVVAILGLLPPALE